MIVVNEIVMVDKVVARRNQDDAVCIIFGIVVHEQVISRIIQVEAVIYVVVNGVFCEQVVARII